MSASRSKEEFQGLKGLGEELRRNCFRYETSHPSREPIVMLEKLAAILEERNSIAPIRPIPTTNQREGLICTVRWSYWYSLPVLPTWNLFVPVCSSYRSLLSSDDGGL
jgi:hypothetical protein